MNEDIITDGTVGELMSVLERFPKDMKIILASDEEENELKGLWGFRSIEIGKSNNNGSYDALLLTPNGYLYEEYSQEDED